MIRELFRACGGSRAVTVLLALAAALSAVAQDAPAVFRAGAAAVDITPTEFPLNMPGNFAANMAERAHDPLHARAIVLDDGATKLAMVVVDNLGVAREAADDAKALAARRCGIPVDRILVSATHTHTAPPSNVKEGSPPEVAYRKVLVEGIAEAIVRAHAALRPAAVGAASHPLPDEVFNRRWFLKPGQMKPNPFGLIDTVKMNPPTDPAVLDRPAGPTDPDVTVLSVQEAASGKPIAVYANYSLHYVGGTPRGAVSADYYGEFARLMPSRVGGAKAADFVAMMSNGASGDVNNIPFGVRRPPREPFEQVRIVAQKAADAAWHARGKIERHRADVRLGMVERHVTLQMRRPTAGQVEWANGVLATAAEEAAKAGDGKAGDAKGGAAASKLPPLAEVYARRTLALANAGETIDVPLQAIRIGDFAVCAIPFETFVETGLDLKKRSLFPRTIVVGIANAYNGYLPTPEQHKLGGYETWLGTNRVQEDASVVLTGQLLEMLAELAKQE